MLRRVAFLPLVLSLVACGSSSARTVVPVAYAICFPVALPLGTGAADLRASVCDPGAIDGAFPDARGTMTFAYDSSGYLTSITWSPIGGVDETSTFDWDAAGLLTNARIGPSDHPDLAIDGVSRDPAGRLTARTVTAADGAQASWTYSYDADGTLGSVQDDEGQGHVRDEMLSYDAGLLSSRQVSVGGKVTETWLYSWGADGLGQIDATVGDKTTQTLFSYSAGQADGWDVVVGGNTVEQAMLSWGPGGGGLDLVQALRGGRTHERMTMQYDSEGRVASIALEQP